MAGSENDVLYVAPHASEDVAGCCVLGLERPLSFSGI